MSKDAIHKQVHAQPFVPFRLHMADGTAYTVPARDFISIGPQGRTIVVWEGNHLRILDALLVTQIDIQELV